MARNEEQRLIDEFLATKVPFETFGYADIRRETGVSKPSKPLGRYLATGTVKSQVDAKGRKLLWRTGGWRPHETRDDLCRRTLAAMPGEFTTSEFSAKAGVNASPWLSKMRADGEIDCRKSAGKAFIWIKLSDGPAGTMAANGGECVLTAADFLREHVRVANELVLTRKKLEDAEADIAALIEETNGLREDVQSLKADGGNRKDGATQDEIRQAMQLRL
jgi:hypothetical protein